MHYQIHRGIGVHHTAALRSGKSLDVQVFVGGTPAMTLAAVMPLPEGISELGFAGAMAGFRIPMTPQERWQVYSDADFCITGTIENNLQLPEGPFGDHLGYYSLQHPFPVLKVRKVTHRDDAIWPFTVVGRPPQEDTMFGRLIHEITASILPTVLSGVREVHAVDAAGVHPLLLAIGSERYTPYMSERQPQEILTQANAILGQGQLSLAKYLWIIDSHSCPEVSTHDVAEFLQAVLRRVDWHRDLHFQTQTTIDTLDYSGDGLNRGSKVVIAAAGPPIRKLALRIDPPTKVGSIDLRLGMPGVAVVCGLPFPENARSDPTLAERLAALLNGLDLKEIPLIVVVDDAAFAAASLENWIWVTFTRSNPATDVHGLDAAVTDKHWGCRGSLIIDARIKPHHAPVLQVDPETASRVDAMAARGGPLARYL